MDYSNDNAIAALQQAFREKNLTLYLGAGVSMANKLPSWEKLVLAMYFSTISEQYMQGWRPFSNYLYAIAEWQLKNNPEPLEITARKLRKYYSAGEDDETRFLENLYATLYGSLLDNDGEPHHFIDGAFLRNTNQTLDAVTRLCESPANGVRSVITYNYDNFLEMALADHQHQAIFNETDFRAGRLPVYHVHGYVPLQKNVVRSTGSDIVFTEDQYHRVAGDPYYWSNLVQIQAMANSVGLMVGLSLSDRNMRRLLDAVRNAPIPSRHYAILMVPDKSAPANEVLDDIHAKAIDYLRDFESGGIKTERSDSEGVLYPKPGVKSAEPLVRAAAAKSKGPRYRVEIAGIIEQVKRLDMEQHQYVLEQLGITPVWIRDFGEIETIARQIMA